MDIEKLIEAAKLYGIDAADAITALLAENEKLSKMYQEEKAVCHATQAELEKVRESLDFARTKDAELIRLGMELDHLKKHVKRLTHKLGNGEIVCNMARDDCRKMGGDCQIDSKILDSLAAYEDTGLEPKEVAKMAAEWTKYETAMSYVDEIGINRLRELAQADRLIGQTVYEPNKRGVVSTYKVISIHISECSVLVGWELLDGIYSNLNGFEISALSKTVFLTRAEAEAALRREQNG